VENRSLRGQAHNLPRIRKKEDRGFCRGVLDHVPGPAETAQKPRGDEKRKKQCNPSFNRADYKWDGKKRGSMRHYPRRKPASKVWRWELLSYANPDEIKKRGEGREKKILLFFRITSKMKWGRVAEICSKTLGVGESKIEYKTRIVGRNVYLMAGRYKAKKKKGGRRLSKSKLC